MRYALAFFVGMLIFSACGESSPKLINGKPLPDISLPDASGKEISIAELKGNIVLVDIWASWCKPCRKVNPKIVELVKKYEYAQFTNAQRFIIYSLSLDNDREAWLKAIKDDNLDWEWHVCELNGWKSKAVSTYGINSIPTTFLLDENGIIIGKNLGHRDIDKILQRRIIQ